MVKSVDHVTIVVRDVEGAKRFFGLLGFKEVRTVLISGPVMDEYMGIPGIEADHITLAVDNPHAEVQLLHYRKPDAVPDADEAGVGHGRIEPAHGLSSTVRFQAP